MRTRNILIAALVAAAAFSVSACHVTEAGREASRASWQDKPALIFCQGYNGVIFDGQSTGKIIYDEGGRYTFVNAQTGRLTVVEGECRVEYAR